MSEHICSGTCAEHKDASDVYITITIGDIYIDYTDKDNGTFVENVFMLEEEEETDGFPEVDDL